MRERAVSFDDYLRDLDQTLVIARASPATLTRVAQMHLRTNQFNLTTERYDAAAIKAMIEDDRCVVLLGRALDKFGDHGIVICATARVDGGDATIQSFLMSCRVIGREVETTFLGELLKLLGERGAGRVQGAYIPTKKNDLVRDFYEKEGFSRLSSLGKTEVWGWDLSVARPLPGSNLVKVQWEE